MGGPVYLGMLSAREVLNGSYETGCIFPLLVGPAGLLFNLRFFGMFLYLLGF